MLLKASTHVRAAICSSLSVNASLVRAAYGTILRSLDPAAYCRQILERPPRLRNVNRRRYLATRRAHDSRFGNMHVLHRSAFIFRCKPWFRLFPFGHLPLGPFFRDHNIVVVAQDAAGLRKRRRRQRRGQKDQHNHPRVAHHRKTVSVLRATHLLDLGPT